MNPRSPTPAAADHPGDFYDESPEDSFFLPDGTREMGCQEEISTLLNADDGVVLLVHLARECTAHYAWINSVLHYRHMYPRVVQLPMTKDRQRIHFIEASNLDAMLGRVTALRERIRQALDDEETRILVLASACLAEMTGMHLRGVLEEETASSPVPTVFLELTVDENTPMAELWAGLLQLARSDQKPQEGVVNLVGYAADNSPFAREAEAILSRFGARINGWFIPSFRTDAAESYLGAACTLINTAEVVEVEIADVRRKFPAMRYLDQDPPYGPEATRMFYRRILQGSRPDTPIDLLQQAWEPFRKSWERWRKRAAEHTAAFLVKPGEEQFLIQPDKMYGIDMVRVLREMGFHVRILCLGTESLSEKLATHFFSELVADPGVEVEAFGEVDGPVSALIETIDASLVFTEFPPDQRILDGGKMHFHPRDFELGFGGALRSIVRLTRLAESSFHRALDPKNPAGYQT